MVAVLSPTGIEKPAGPEQHSLALYNRNLDRTNDIEKARRAVSNIPFGHAGATAGFQTIAGSNVAVNITNQQLRGGMTFEATSGGRFVIPRDGLYIVRIKAYATEASGYDFMFDAYKNSVALRGNEIFDYKQTTSDYKQHSECTYPFVAGDKIGLGATTPNKTWGTDGYNGAFLEVEFKME